MNERNGANRGVLGLIARGAVGVLFVALLAWLAVASWHGCHRETEPDDALAEEQKKKEQQASPLELPRLSTRPANPQVPGLWHKPGHWTSFSVGDARANEADFQGELELGASDNRGNPAAVPGTGYELLSSRPVVLPKQQPKLLEVQAWVPIESDPGGFSCFLTRSPGGVREFGYLLSATSSRMPSYQYHFVVMARTSDRYRYLETQLASIRESTAPDASAGNEDTIDMTVSVPIQSYRVVRMPDRRPELPSHALCWTTIAYVLWDDYDPSLLDSQQQQAMLDWLHWGGQLILSGPDTLDTLQGSFLAPYLPAKSTGSRTLAAGDIEALGSATEPVGISKPWSGIALQVHPKARAMAETGGLIVERAVGRGRIVATAFRLNERELVRWPGLDDLFNRCLLRRQGMPQGNRVANVPRSTWSDAAMNTQVRFMARDAGVAADRYGADVASRELLPVADPFANPSGGPAYQTINLAAPGLAAWNDTSPVAQRARKALIDAAGIHVPSRVYIVWLLVGYLVVLVPVNGLVFRLIGRVEWAWAAAPLITVAWTVLVVHLADLDVGLARAQSEVALVEFQDGYGRAHVTRYTALYTSLSTDYDVEMNDLGAQVLPMPSTDADGRLEVLSRWQSRRRLLCHRGEGTSLTGFRVNSNSIDILHSEEMVDVGGGLSLTVGDDRVWRLGNQTPWTLRDVVIVRRVDEKTYESVAAARLGSKTRLPLEFTREDTAAQKPVAATKGQIDLGELSQLAGRLDLQPGQARMVARLEEGIPLLDVRPAASQPRQSVLVVAHFGHSPAGQNGGNE